MIHQCFLSVSDVLVICFLETCVVGVVAVMTESGPILEVVVPVSLLLVVEPVLVSVLGLFSVVVGSSVLLPT